MLAQQVLGKEVEISIKIVKEKIEKSLRGEVGDFVWFKVFEEKPWDTWEFGEREVDEFAENLVKWPWLILPSVI